AGSAHITGYATIDLPGLARSSLKMQEVGNESWKGKTQAYVKGTFAAHLKLPVVRIKQVGKKIAEKLGNTWSCSAGSSLEAVSTAPTSAGATVSLNKWTLLGPETVDSVTTWHVRETGLVTSGKHNKQKTHIRLDEYVAQSNYQVLRMMVRSEGTFEKQKLAIAEQVNFAQYGKKVHVTLPKKCSGSASAVFFRGVLSERVLVAAMRGLPDTAGLPAI
ncbi:MAG: hypothetical protein ACRDFS_11930, partial [Chloroflexota bacterium]